MELVEIQLSGSGSPSGSVTPDFAGQQYHDTATDDVYISFGTTNTDWGIIYDAP